MHRSTERSILREMDKLAKEKEWPTDQNYHVHGLRSGGLQHRLQKGQPIEYVRSIGHWAEGSQVFNHYRKKAAHGKVKI